MDQDERESMLNHTHLRFIHPNPHTLRVPSIHRHEAIANRLHISVASLIQLQPEICEDMSQREIELSVSQATTPSEFVSSLTIDKTKLT